MTYRELLEHLNACQEAINWTQDKPIEQAIKECPRGDWLLWLAEELELDERKRYLAAGHCANTVRHLMKNKRSIAAVDGAIAYGKSEISKNELEVLREEAINASWAAASAAAYWASAATRTKNQLQTADICREHLGQLLIDEVNKRLNKQSK